MRKLLPILLLPLLGACATTTQVAPPEHPATAGVGVTPTWLADNTMAVHLDDRRYVGTWTSMQCTTDICRGVFRDVARIHRRHVRRGEAELVAADGARMRCTWVSNQPLLYGTCSTADGRRLDLRNEPAGAAG